MIHRTVETAEHLFAAGDVEGARGLLEGVIATLPYGPARADTLRRLATVRYWQDGWDAAAALLVEAEGQLGNDPGSRRRSERLSLTSPSNAARQPSPTSEPEPRSILQGT